MVMPSRESGQFGVGLAATHDTDIINCFIVPDTGYQRYVENCSPFDKCIPLGEPSPNLINNYNQVSSELLNRTTCLPK